MDSRAWKLSVRSPPCWASAPASLPQQQWGKGKATTGVCSSLLPNAILFVEQCNGGNLLWQKSRKKVDNRVGCAGVGYFHLWWETLPQLAQDFPRWRIPTGSCPCPQSTGQSGGMQCASSDSSSPDTTVSPVPTHYWWEAKKWWLRQSGESCMLQICSPKPTQWTSFFLSNLPFFQKLITSLNVSRCTIFVHSGHSYD